VVQWTAHRVLDDEAIRQGAMIMRAKRADREYTRATPHNNHVILINLACYRLTLREILEWKSGLEVWHLLIIHCRIQSWLSFAVNRRSGSVNNICIIASQERNDNQNPEARAIDRPIWRRKK
jgi:hypothetical protein